MDYYKIVNTKTGKVLNRHGSVGKPVVKGCGLTLYSDTGSADQLFKLDYDGDFPALRIQCNESFVLNRDSRNNNAILWPFASSTKKDMLINTETVGDVSRIRLVGHPNLYLTASALTDGAKVVWAPKKDSDLQYWSLKKVDAGGYGSSAPGQADDTGVQKALFIQEMLRVTQGPYTQGSHKGIPAVDFGGQFDGSRGKVDKCFAPYDAKVVRLVNNANGECYIESLKPVLSAEGKVSYQNMLLLHTEQFDVKVGQVIKQGQHFYTEGGMAYGKRGAQPIHIHVLAGYGKSPARMQKAASGKYTIAGATDITKLLFIPASTKISNGGGLSWKKAG